MVPLCNEIGDMKAGRHYVVTGMVLPSVLLLSEFQCRRRLNGKRDIVFFSEIFDDPNLLDRILGSGRSWAENEVLHDYVVRLLLFYKVNNGLSAIDLPAFSDPITSVQAKSYGFSGVDS